MAPKLNLFTAKKAASALRQPSAVAHAQRGELAEAVAHIERAIAMNPENRALARTDPDLDPLRDDDSFRMALEAPAVPRMERRRPVRPRSAR